jgi:hypothetical protein
MEDWESGGVGKWTEKVEEWGSGRLRKWRTGEVEDRGSGGMRVT